MEVVVLLVVKSAFATGCYFIARKKGRSGAAWAVLGFIFSLFALIIIGLLSKPTDARAKVTGRSTYDRNRWATLLTSDPAVVEAVEKLKPLGQTYIDRFAERYLSRTGDESIQAILNSVVRARDVEGIPPDYRQLDEQIHCVYATPWGGIVVLKKSHLTIVLRGPESELLDDFATYRQRHELEDTSKWQEVTERQERHEFVAATYVFLTRQNQAKSRARIDARDGLDSGLVAREATPRSPRDSMPALDGLPSPIHPRKLLISFRRGDEEAMARRMGQQLGRRYGRANVALGLDERPLAGIGEKPHLATSAAELAAKLAQCDALLAVIGRRWLEQLKGLEARGEPDHIRTAIATALRCGIPVVPVLIEPATLPSSDDLPEDVREIIRHQQRPVPQRFGPRLEVLIASMGGGSRSARRSLRLLGLAAIGAVLAGSAALALMRMPPRGPTPKTMTTGMQTAASIIQTGSREDARSELYKTIMAAIDAREISRGSPADIGKKAGDVYKSYPPPKARVVCIDWTITTPKNVNAGKPIVFWQLSDLCKGFSPERCGRRAQEYCEAAGICKGLNQKCVIVDINATNALVLDPS